MVLLIGVLICGYKASVKPHFFQFANSQTGDEEMGSMMGESAENLLWIWVKVSPKIALSSSHFPFIRCQQQGCLGQIKKCNFNHRKKYGLQGPQPIRGDSITDGWSTPDFVKETLVRKSSSATSTSSQSVSCMGEVDSIQTSFKLLFTLQQ
jgi:hypothetical protein